MYLPIPYWAPSRLKYLYCHSIQSLTSNSFMPRLMKGSSFISTPARASIGSWSQQRSCTS